MCEGVRLKRGALARDSFCATLMEWTSPLTERKGAEHYNALTLAAADTSPTSAPRSPRPRRPAHIPTDVVQLGR